VAFLLDTNVVSELRRSAPHPAVLAWYQRNTDAEAYLSVLVVGEIRQGIERVRPRDPKQADALDRWLGGLLSTYRERILPVTVEIAQEWGRGNVPPHAPPTIDGLLAATAKVHRLTLVTRNVSDVAATGVPVLNPFEPS
jgi:toxin FitB